MAVESLKDQNSGLDGQVFDHWFLKTGVRFNPAVEFLLQLHTNLVFAETKTEKLFISNFMDKYINLGLDWKIPGVQDVSGSQDFLQAIHNHAMVVRKEAFPKYDSRFLKKYLDIIDTVLFGPLKSRSFFVIQRIKNILLRIKKVLDAPERIGLACEFCFSTCQQEIRSLVLQIKELSIRHNSFTQKWFPTIEDEILDCLNVS